MAENDYTLEFEDRGSYLYAHLTGMDSFAASLSYFDSYRQARLPANLLQAQRDFFGAHTYERVDKEGVFHTDWLNA